MSTKTRKHTIRKPRMDTNRASGKKGPTESHRIIQPVALKKALENHHHYVVIDVRSEIEFDKEHIDGSINIPFEQLLAQIKTVEGSEQMVLVCETGKLARRAALKLEEMGVPVMALEGGIMLWRCSGLCTKHNLRIPVEQKIDIIFGAGAFTTVAIFLASLPMTAWIAAPIVCAIAFDAMGKKLERAKNEN